jgi:hypothetical protein
VHKPAATQLGDPESVGAKAAGSYSGAVVEVSSRARGGAAPGIYSRCSGEFAGAKAACVTLGRRQQECASAIAAGAIPSRG